MQTMQRLRSSGLYWIWTVLLFFPQRWLIGKAPSLLIYNNQRFTEKDFDGYDRYNNIYHSILFAVLSFFSAFLTFSVNMFQLFLYQIYRDWSGSMCGYYWFYKYNGYVYIQKTNWSTMILFPLHLPSLFVCSLVSRLILALLIFEIDYAITI